MWSGLAVVFPAAAAAAAAKDSLLVFHKRLLSVTQSDELPSLMMLFFLQQLQ